MQTNTNTNQFINQHQDSFHLTAKKSILIATLLLASGFGIGFVVGNIDTETTVVIESTPNYKLDKAEVKSAYINGDLYVPITNKGSSHNLENAKELSDAQMAYINGDTDKIKSNTGIGSYYDTNLPHDIAPSYDYDSEPSGSGVALSQYDADVIIESE